jgi:hypothetical protein
MTAGFKVKLEDGSVVGPLDPDMLRSWYQQGLIEHETPVLPSGQKRWGTLRDVLEPTLVKSKNKKTKAKAADGADEYEDEAYEEPALTHHGRLLAGGVLIAGAIGAIAALFMPDAWRADLTPMPWRELGYAQVLLALTALHDAEWTRRVARVGVFLAGFCMFPLIGIALAQGVPAGALVVLGSAWVVASGLFFMLAPALPWKHLAATLVVVLGGVYGLIRFGVVYAADAAISATHAGWLSEIVPRGL